MVETGQPKPLKSQSKAMPELLHDKERMILKKNSRVRVLAREIFPYRERLQFFPFLRAEFYFEYNTVNHDNA